ncbi:MAG: lipopolysaccharide exporter [Roseivirga sp.]|jgi:lipopolysaccharide exporter
MLSKIRKSKFAMHTAWAMGGQLSFLLANFLLFILLVNEFSKETFGIWALYITVISIIDSIRQGLVQNGLTRLIINDPKNRSIKSAGTLINYTVILLSSLLLLIVPQLLSGNIELNFLLKHAWKTLLVLGTIQLIATFCQAKSDFKTYFKVNVLYLIGFAGLLFYMRSQSVDLSLIQLVNCQVYALIVPVIYYLIASKPKWKLPLISDLKRLFSFGKYVSGTNLLSMIFHKADILMIAYFLDPTAVALFHFASKIMNYAELPLQALSQVIYPRISASYQSNTAGDLNKEYGMSVLRLLVFVIPICIVLIMLNKEIIYLLSSGDYTESSQLIIILSIGMMLKPVGRVLGLTLDAIGKPDVNFRMLLISVALNLCMNLILIPQFGLSGAAIATTLSIIITILIGQLSLIRHTAIKPIRDITNSIKQNFNSLKLMSWN